ncbi:MAG: UDP-N-acetylmuramoyl-tripeptide--D-alanyl-D-alanine ligase [Bacteroidetes bacterium]|nr:UDP-N-acetylmuramoyl-tripeptide--D-alanyl-D-alanine ligase [Bacteroidota bacterium]
MEKVDSRFVFRILAEQQMKFTTDSRKVENGSVFFALKGESFNGNLFALKALESGASYVVVDEDIASEQSGILVVDDVLKCFQEVATHYRRTFKIPFLAVAGSNGKTTTKELIKACLSKKYKVHATSGNFNNHIGVPITLLTMPADTELAVIEIGTNSFGEIETLCKILEPDYGLITNIGKEHLEGFGDLDGVAREESELYNYLIQHRGFAFINADDPYLFRMSHRISNKISYGFSDPAEMHFTIISTLPEIQIEQNKTFFRSAMQGIHNASNIACAVTVASHFGVAVPEIQASISGYQPANNRSEMRVIGSNHIILDAYNANPSSMEVAIESFVKSDVPNKVLLLGDMFELGNYSDEEHFNLAERVSKLSDIQYHLCGDAFQRAAEKLGLPSFKNVDELNNHLSKQTFENAWFLVKGSRGMKMERVLEALGN